MVRHHRESRVDAPEDRVGHGQRLPGRFLVGVPPRLRGAGGRTGRKSLSDRRSDGLSERTGHPPRCGGERLTKYTYAYVNGFPVSHVERRERPLRARLRGDV